MLTVKAFLGFAFPAGAKSDREAAHGRLVGACSELKRRVLSRRREVGVCLPVEEGARDCDLRACRFSQSSAIPSTNLGSKRVPQSRESFQRYRKRPAMLASRGVCCSTTALTSALTLSRYCTATSHPSLAATCSGAPLLLGASSSHRAATRTFRAAIDSVWAATCRGRKPLLVVLSFSSPCSDKIFLKVFSSFSTTAAAMAPGEARSVKAC